MSIEPLHHPAVKLLCGQGVDLPSQAARARFEALSEFQHALQQPLLHRPAPALRTRHYRQSWHLVALALLVLQLGVGLWLSLDG